MPNTSSDLMSEIAFARLPFITKLATLLSFFLGWVMFAEFVIDRQGWDEFLPFYRVGAFCPYDLAVIAILAIWWVLNEWKTLAQEVGPDGCC